MMVSMLMQGQDHMKALLRKQEAKHESVALAISELKDMMSQQIRTSFSLKTANLEVM